MICEPSSVGVPAGDIETFPTAPRRAGGCARAAWLLALSSAALFAGCARCGDKPATAPPDAELTRVPDGFGRPWGGEPVLEVGADAVRLPTGDACAPSTAECQAKLAGLRGKPLAVRLERSLVMGQLSAPLAALAAAREDDASFCLLASDSDSRRCIAFAPFSGEDFGAWLDADKPLGKVRVVMRADGLEVVADRGKVPGPDRYGPSLPPVGGKPDFDGLERTMRLMAKRFPDEEEAALAPSPRISAEQAVRALAILNGPDGERFARTFLVYP